MYKIYFKSSIINYQNHHHFHHLLPLHTSSLSSDNANTPHSKIKWVQKIVVSLLCYDRSIDDKILPELNTIYTKQAAATKQTKYQFHRILDYIATQPNISLRCHKSDMVLTIDSDASYLV